MINIVGLEHCPGDFLAEIILLVGASGRTEKAKTVRTIGVFDMGEFFGQNREGIFPGGRFEHPVFPDQGLGEAVPAVDEFMRSISLDTEFPVVQMVFFQGQGVDQFTIQYFKKHLTPATTIGAGGFYTLIVHCKARFLLKKS